MYYTYISNNTENISQKKIFKKIFKNKITILEKVSLSSLLIIGVFLSTSIAAFAQDYKGKCKDKIEKDMDKCRVELKNNILNLKFKESELNQIINLNNVDHLEIESESSYNHWTMRVNYFKSFTFIWHDQSGTYATNFKLEEKDSKELILLLQIKGNRIVKNKINAYYQAIAEQNQRKYQSEQKIIEEPVNIQVSPSPIPPSFPTVTTGQANQTLPQCTRDMIYGGTLADDAVIICVNTLKYQPPIQTLPQCTSDLIYLGILSDKAGQYCQYLLQQQSRNLNRR